MKRYKCTICGYAYDESVGIPEKGIAPGTKWQDIPEDFVCPLCNASKSAFKLIDDEVQPLDVVADADSAEHVENLKELTYGEISAICSNLAIGCEKQRLTDEMNAFYKIADYFQAKVAGEMGKTLDDTAKMLDDDLGVKYPAAFDAAKADADRGALRSIVWSEKVSLMTKSLLERFAKEGEAMLANSKIYVCDICGFIYIGDTPPEVCPVCKVPSFKMLAVERR
ncbi:MAG: rubredoxin [Dehalococcoidia bacterium]|nr:rubredoxin [Dehalococcoidia bacterium]